MAKSRPRRLPRSAVFALACGLASAWWFHDDRIGSAPRPPSSAAAPSETITSNHPPAPQPPLAPPPPGFGGGYGRDARVIEREEALAHYALGVEFLNLGDYYTAASHLALARAGVGDDSRVCELLAVAYDRLNMTRDLLDIMPCLDELASEHASAAALFDRLDKQLDVEEEFLAASSDHFVASYPATGTSAEAIGSVLDVLERARSSVEDDLGLGSTRLVPVVVYEGEQFSAATDKPHWASGLYDGKIRMSLDTWHEQPEFFETAITHEYVHALTHEFTDTRLPPWFREGLADALARNGSERARELAPGVNVDRILEMDQLDASFMTLGEDAARAAYLQSQSMVLGLVNESGWGAVQDLILDLRDDRSLDFHSAFDRIYGESPADYLDRWYGDSRR